MRTVRCRTQRAKMKKDPRGSYSIPRDCRLIRRLPCSSAQPGVPPCSSFDPNGMRWSDLCSLASSSPSRSWALAGRGARQRAAANDAGASHRQGDVRQGSTSEGFTGQGDRPHSGVAREGVCLEVTTRISSQRECPLWVESGHSRVSAFDQKRSFWPQTRSQCGFPTFWSCA